MLDLVRHAEQISHQKPGGNVRPPEARGTEGTSNNPDSQRPRSDGRISPETEQRLAELVARGEILQAVKAYRTLTGASLAEAKDYVDSFRQGTPSGAGCSAGCLKATVGCFVVIVVTVVVIGMLAAFFG